MAVGEMVVVVVGVVDVGGGRKVIDVCVLTDCVRVFFLEHPTDMRMSPVLSPSKRIGLTSSEEEDDEEEEEMGGSIDLNQQAFLEGIGAPEDNGDEMGLVVEEEEFYREDEEEAAQLAWEREASGGRSEGHGQGRKSSVH